MQNRDNDPTATRAAMRSSSTFIDVANPRPERVVERVLFLIRRDQKQKLCGPLDAFSEGQLLEKSGVRFFLREITSDLAKYQCHESELDQGRFGYRQLVLDDLDANGIYLNGDITSADANEEVHEETEKTFFIPWGNIVSMQAEDTESLYWIAV